MSPTSTARRLLFGEVASVRSVAPVSEPFAGPLPPLDSTAPPWPGRVLDAGGISLHVRETPGADGATAVFVHGLGGSATNWTDLAAQLSGHADGLAVDLPGFGHSEPPAGYSFTPVAQARAVVALIEHHARNRPVELLGNSLGGLVSVLVAASRPDLVHTLTLISPAVPDWRPDLRRISDPRLALAYLPVIGRQARRNLAALTLTERVDQMRRLCFAEPWKCEQERIDQIVAEFAERDAMPWARAALGAATIEMIKAWFMAGAGSLWRQLRRVCAPALVIWGAEDRLVSVRKAPRTARFLRNGQLLVLAKTGHVAQMERPEMVARAVLGMWMRNR